jgi:hypothetical protein
MRKKAFILAAIYSGLVIAFKVFIWKSGNTFDTSYRWAHAYSLLAIIPFIFGGVRWVRDSENAGYITGKAAGQTGLTIALFSGIILFAYHYIEFNSSLELYKSYYQSEGFKLGLAQDPKVKTIGVDKAVEMMIANLSPFKAATMKLISLLVVAFPCAFLCALFMKKSAPQNL